MQINLIWAQARNGVIGKDNAIPWRLAQDLARLKALTLGHPVIMGRKTHASIGRALPGRLNIVLSRGDTVATVPGQVVVAHDVATAHRLAADWLREQAAPGLSAEVFVIGGAEVYAQSLPFADRLYLTEIDAEFSGHNHFPDFRAESMRWAEVSRESHQAEPPNIFRYAFVTLDRLPS
jgi:dihydrofolate reductase